MRVDTLRTAGVEAAWRSGEFFGDNIPTARVTVHRINVRLTGTRDYGDFASIIFGAGDGLTNASRVPVEIPTIKSVAWNRSVDTNVADCTIEIWNTYENPVTGESIPGYYTWNRGASPFDKARGIAKNSWFGWLVPDNVIRTFEGYGVDWTKAPEADPHLFPTGALGDRGARGRGLGRMALPAAFRAGWVEGIASCSAGRGSDRIEHSLTGVGLAGKPSSLVAVSFSLRPVAPIAAHRRDAGSAATAAVIAPGGCVQYRVCQVASAVFAVGVAAATGRRQVHPSVVAWIAVEVIDDQ